MSKVESKRPADLIRPQPLKNPGGIVQAGEVAPVRGPDGKFIPGHSGNPGGRPGEYAEMVRVMRAGTYDAYNTIHGIMMNKDAPDKIRLQAAEMLLDRGWGKTATLVKTFSEHTVGGKIREIPTEQLEQLVAKAASKRIPAIVAESPTDKGAQEDE